MGWNANCMHSGDVMVYVRSCRGRSFAGPSRHGRYSLKGWPLAIQLECGNRTEHLGRSTNPGVLHGDVCGQCKDDSIRAVRECRQAALDALASATLKHTSNPLPSSEFYREPPHCRRTKQADTNTKLCPTHRHCHPPPHRSPTVRHRSHPSVYMSLESIA
jgi:hypothetical protein